MKILVLGHKGQLGQCLRDQLSKQDYKVVYASREKIDIANFEDTKNKIKELSPSIVINATAYSAVDKAEEDKEQAYLINHLAVASLADICRELNCWLLHVSTDYVFDGNSSLPYKEGDKTNPQGVYGQSKLMGEEAIQSSGCKYLIFRTAWVFSEYGSNFLKTMLQLGETHDELKVVDDQIGCPTPAQDLARAMIHIIKYIKTSDVTPGIYNLCGDHPCSWYEFARKIFIAAKKKRLSIPKRVYPIDSSEFPTKALRPAYSVLDCSKIRKQFNINPPSWEKGIQLVMNKL